MSLRRRSVCLLPLAAPAAWAVSEERAPLRVGWSDYPPLQFPASGGQPQGLDVELLDLLARAARERLQWLRRPWARQMSDVAQGELDIVTSATPSPERMVLGEFTQAYRMERVALLALAGETPALRRLAELKGRPVRIGVIRGVVFPAAVRRELEDPELARLLVILHANDLTLSALRAGRVDYVIDDPGTLALRAAREPGAALKVVLELAVSPVHLLVGRPTLAQRPDLMQRLNHGLQAARRTPEWAQVLARYPGY
ncbi:transporter substrate-binding domain-containing protein [Roseateles asaccharophilus]|uniref:ABC-type amino acid transport substrate-binding protein n=1 Tax=Roseateles asaccharophilus TaxID=582607 RepID=A0ABU2AFF2_9BURK|nr:transporter substrate-binding domain-containing protein [Roseateles asaccharophilus]MDR7335909.1 ABC-type amino acid transport substrate-binding protein [Roseateles asaccharophilus]